MSLTPRSSAKRLHTHSFSARKLAPMVELMENRQLLTGGAATGFLTGSVLTDGSSGNPVSGVTVELFKASNTGTPISIQTTGANGQYLFTGLQPGDYLLKDIAPKGYTTNGSNPLDQIDPATSVGTDTIAVTVVDPNSVFVNYNGIIPSSFSVVDDSVNGTSQVNSVGPQSDTLGSSPGATNYSAGFQTFCVNDQESLSFGGGEQYQVTPKPITALTNGNGTISADAAGRIAYLYNHFGNSSLTNVQGAGLQLAIWELLYDGGSTPNFAAGAFQVTGQYESVNGETLSQVISQAESYYNQSAGKSETAMVLDASCYSSTGQGVQSVLATEALDFTLHQSCSPCGPTGPVCPPPTPVCPPSPPVCHPAPPVCPPSPPVCHPAPPVCPPSPPVCHPAPPVCPPSTPICPPTTGPGWDHDHQGGSICQVVDNFLNDLCQDQFSGDNGGSSSSHGGSSCDNGGSSSSHGGSSCDSGGSSQYGSGSYCHS